MSFFSPQTSIATTSQTALTSPRMLRIQKTGWALFFIASFLIFTIVKFPKEALSEWLVNYVNDQLKSQGLTLSSDHSNLTLGFGVTLKLSGVTLGILSSNKELTFDEAAFSPGLLSAMFNKTSGTLELKQGSGLVHVDFQIPNSPTQSTPGSLQFHIQSLDLKKTGIFSILISSLFPKFSGSDTVFQFQGDGILEGNGSIDGNFSAMNSLDGTLNIGIKSVKIEEKTIFGFHVPNLSISSLKLDVSLIKGKATIRALETGGQPTDDLTGKLSGEILLGKEMQGSSTHLKTQFTLSQSVKDAVGPILQNIDNLKKPDGSYAAVFSGSWGSLVPAPDKTP